LTRCRLRSETDRDFSNRRLDNKLNIFEGILRNPFFIVINIIMIGGQVLIIWVGGDAFEIVKLNGKEWGLSIGLGAISIPWGALIRLTPDEWFAKCVPGFFRRRWFPTPEEQAEREKNGTDKEEEFEKPPLRTMSSLRGPRVQQHIGFRYRMHQLKAKTKEKVHGSKESLAKKSRESVAERRSGSREGVVVKPVGSKEQVKENGVEQ
jgi:P-type Ca2+ transporter type 2C